MTPSKVIVCSSPPLRVNGVIVEGWAEKLPFSWRYSVTISCPPSRIARSGRGESGPFPEESVPESAVTLGAGARSKCTGMLFPGSTSTDRSSGVRYPPLLTVREYTPSISESMLQGVSNPLSTPSRETLAPAGFEVTSIDPSGSRLDRIWISEINFPESPVVVGYLSPPD